MPNDASSEIYIKVHSFTHLRHPKLHPDDPTVAQSRCECCQSLIRNAFQRYLDIWLGFLVFRHLIDAQPQVVSSDDYFEHTRILDSLKQGT